MDAGVAHVIIQPVILAGGSGTRLWPASRQAHPKQLLALTGPRSLLQETALRLQDFTAAPVIADPIVVTGEEYRFIVVDQLREVGIVAPRVVLEPVGRNTAPALTVAALLDTPGGGDADDGDPVLLVMASDHLIVDTAAFHAAVAEGLTQAEAGALVTFGIAPDGPETGYGYIRIGAPAPGAATAHALAGFTEKPDRATAERYLAEGDYLWNGGIFMMKRSVWLAALDRYRPDIGAACVAALAASKAESWFLHLDQAAFTACPSDSVDYAVMEKLASGAGAAVDDTAPGGTGATSGLAPTAVVIPLACGWSDVGGWGALCAVSPHDADGNAVQGEVILEDTRGSLIRAGSRLVAVLGVDDLVVVDTPDALLVARKDKTADLKELVARVGVAHPQLTLCHRRQYRPWGQFESLHTGERFQVKRLLVSPGAALSLQLHHHRAEHWVVVQGVADVTCGDGTFRLREDESTYIPVDVPHRLANPGPDVLEIIEVQLGDYLGEDDIVRLEDRYGRSTDDPPGAN